MVHVVARWWRSGARKLTIRQRSAPQTSMEQRVVAADGRLTAERSPSRSIHARVANPSPIEERATPGSWSCRFAAGSGRAGHCGTGSAFVPQIALLIATATADRSILAIGRNLEVIRRFFHGRSHGSGPVAVLCRFHGSQREKTLSARKAGQATKASPHKNGPETWTLSSALLAMCRCCRPDSIVKIAQAARLWPAEIILEQDFHFLTLTLAAELFSSF